MTHQLAEHLTPIGSGLTPCPAGGRLSRERATELRDRLAALARARAEASAAARQFVVLAARP